MPHFMIVTSPYYDDISNHLLEGTKAYLDEKHVTYEVIEVPGALEIPLAIKLGLLRPETRGVSSQQFDGYVALGCIIRGETSHYDIVCNESARGIYDLVMKHDLALGNAILTVENKDQAITRADPAQKDKGGDAARAALAMLALKQDLL